MKYLFVWLRFSLSSHNTVRKRLLSLKNLDLLFLRKLNNPLSRNQVNFSLIVSEFLRTTTTKVTSWLKEMIANNLCLFRWHSILDLL